MSTPEEDSWSPEDWELTDEERAALEMRAGVEFDLFAILTLGGLALLIVILVAARPDLALRWMQWCLRLVGFPA